MVKNTDLECIENVKQFVEASQIRVNFHGILVGFLRIAALRKKHRLVIISTWLDLDSIRL